jgi:hypothetical protein
MANNENRVNVDIDLFGFAIVVAWILTVGEPDIIDAVIHYLMAAN